MMKYTTIKGSFSQNRRIPLLGRIRLGLKAKKVRPDGSVVEYPTETDYFVCPPEVQAVYGEQPKDLDVMLPSENVEHIFPQNLAWFGRSGLKCTGNMQEAERLNEQTGVWEKRPCPCEHYKTDQNQKGECTESGTLVVLLPKVSIGGTYQIRTGSYHSVVDINSGIDFVRGLIGRISMVPLTLKRLARVTHNNGKAQTHHTLSLTLDAPLASIPVLQNDNTRVIESARLIQIEGPEPIDPENDGLPADVVEDAEGMQPEQASNQAALEAGRKALAHRQGGNGGHTEKPQVVAQPAPPTPAPVVPQVSNWTTDGELTVPIRQLQADVDGDGILSKILANFQVPLSNRANYPTADDLRAFPQDEETRVCLLEALWEGVSDRMRLARRA